MYGLDKNGSTANMQRICTRTGERTHKYTHARAPAQCHAETPYAHTPACTPAHRDRTRHCDARPSDSAPGAPCPPRRAAAPAHASRRRAARRRRLAITSVRTTRRLVARAARGSRRTRAARLPPPDQRITRPPVAVPDAADAARRHRPRRRCVSFSVGSLAL